MLSGMLYAVLPLFAWLVLRQQRTRALALWCLGSLVFAVGQMLVGNTQHLPRELALTGGNGALFASYLMRVQALRLELHRPYPALPLWLALFAATAVTAFLDLVLKDYVTRASFNSGMSAIGLGMIALHARHIMREEGSRSAGWMAAVYTVFSAVLLLRLSAVVGQQGTDPTLFTETLTSQLLVPVVLVAAVIGHLGYVGLILERSTKRELRLVDEQARTEESRRLGRQIAQLDRQRSLGELSASLGHELNQPLAAALTNVQVAKRGLQSGKLGQTTVIELLDKVASNTQRASQIIDRIRGFIKPNEARSISVDLHDVVGEVVQLVQAETRRLGITVRVMRDPGALRVVGDPIQISQILLNGLRNAMEADAQKGAQHIEVHCFGTDDQAVICIADQGPGLSAEQLAHLGEPFYSSKSGGLGMGFVISRSIAQQHGGSLVLRNSVRTPGGGAEFILSLPKGKGRQP